MAGTGPDRPPAAGTTSVPPGASAAFLRVQEALMVDFARVRGQAEEDPWRQQGLTAALQVRLHQMEIIATSFPKLLLAFTVLQGLISLTLVGLLVWLIVSVFQDFDKECGSPLKVWVLVGFSSTIYHTIHGALLQYFCAIDQNPVRQLPIWERVHLVVSTFFDLFWLGLGVAWLFKSETCASTAPRLFLSSQAYAIASILGTVFMIINMAGLLSIISYLIRNGVLRTKDAAPSGTLEALRVVKFDPDDELFKDNKECCICLADFSKSMEVRFTSCNHAYHSRCLGNWLKVNRTCPLCRCSLVAGESAASAAGGGSGGTSIELAGVAAAVGGQSEPPAAVLGAPRRGEAAVPPTAPPAAAAGVCAE
mmetsp:Transcript_2342/g.6910  ORF Transcript_2342/g.6910 Transcript_2342/m.6910 type:complete len:365 (+) Transcript_2342:107-1201(+)